VPLKAAHCARGATHVLHRAVGVEFELGEESYAFGHGLSLVQRTILPHNAFNMKSALFARHVEHVSPGHMREKSQHVHIFV
jgi:hypothetical protein